MHFPPQFHDKKVSRPVPAGNPPTVESRASLATRASPPGEENAAEEAKLRPLREGRCEDADAVEASELYPDIAYVYPIKKQQNY